MVINHQALHKSRKLPKYPLISDVARSLVLNEKSTAHESGLYMGSETVAPCFVNFLAGRIWGFCFRGSHRLA